MSLLSYDVGDVRASLAFADFIGLLNQPIAETNLRDNYNRLFGEPTSYTYYPRDGLSGGHVVATHDEAGVVICEGAYSQAQGLAYVNAVGEPINYNNSGGANPFVTSLANIVRDHANTGGVYGRPRTWLVGHSLGGVTMVVMGADRLTAVPETNLSILTFGSPKPGPPACCRYIPVSRICRWMNVGDPVPFVMPRTEQAPIMMSLRGVETRNNAARYVQPAGGVQIATDGTTQVRELPEVDPTTIEPAIFQWLQSLRGNLLHPHQIDSYYSSLLSYDERFPSVSPIEGRTHSAGRPSQTTPTEARQAQEEAIRRLRSQIRDAGTPNVRIPHDKLFHAVKNGPLWTVTFLGQQIIIGPTRRKARAFASHANQLVARLQTMGAVGIDGFTVLWGEYLLLASSVNGGFVPVMRTFGS